MSKLKYLLAPLVLSLFLIPNGIAFAQEQYELYDTEYEYDYEANWEDIEDTYDDNVGYNMDDNDYIGSGILATLLAGAYLTYIAIISIGTYVFTAITVMEIGKKLGYQNPWYAWVPVLNVIMLFQLGDQNPWLLLLFLIPGIGAIVIAILTVISYMKICEKRGFDKLLGLLSLVPLANYFLLGMLAWKNGNSSQVVER